MTQRHLTILGLAAVCASSPAQDLGPRIAALKNVVAAQESQIAALEAKLAGIRSRHTGQVTLANAERARGLTHQAQVVVVTPIGTMLPATFAPLTVTGKRMILDGVNLQVRHSTNPTGPANGLGNLIFGFNRQNPKGDATRTGSHNIVLGNGHSYRKMNGLVGGTNNAIGFDGYGDQNYSVVLSGTSNKAEAAFSVVGTGTSNRATGGYSAILTGMGGWAASSRGLIGTGWQNVVQGGSGNVLMTGTQNWTNGYQNAGLTGFNGMLNGMNYRCVLAGTTRGQTWDSYIFVDWKESL